MHTTIVELVKLKSAYIVKQIYEKPTPVKKTIDTVCMENYLQRDFNVSFKF